MEFLDTFPDLQDEDFQDDFEMKPDIKMEETEFDYEHVDKKVGKKPRKYGKFSGKKKTSQLLVQCPKCDKSLVKSSLAKHLTVSSFIHF